jgi:hypothetical protein
MSKNVPTAVLLGVSTRWHAYYLKLPREYWNDFWASQEIFARQKTLSQRREDAKKSANCNRQRPESWPQELLATDWHGGNTEEKSRNSPWNDRRAGIPSHNLPLPCRRRGRTRSSELGPGVTGPGGTQGTPHTKLDIVVVERDRAIALRGIHSTWVTAASGNPLLFVTITVQR